MLEVKGFHDYAFVIADGTGHARVHTVGQGKKFLDSAALAAQTEKIKMPLPRALPKFWNREISTDPITAFDDERPTMLNDDNDDEPDHTSRSGTRGRAGRTAQHRGLTMRPEIEISTASPSGLYKNQSTMSKPIQVPAVPEDRANSQAALRPAHSRQTESKLWSIRLNDEAAIVAFLGSRLEAMQQVVDKKIAKAWIKAICPNKRARFPYPEKTREVHKVPAWWPSFDDCPFAKPDHIKCERTYIITLLITYAEPRQPSSPS